MKGPQGWCSGKEPGEDPRIQEVRLKKAMAGVLGIVWAMGHMSLFLKPVTSEECKMVLLEGKGQSLPEVLFQGCGE